MENDFMLQHSKRKIIVSIALWLAAITPVAFAQDDTATDLQQLQTVQQSTPSNPASSAVPTAQTSTTTTNPSVPSALQERLLTAASPVGSNQQGTVAGANAPAQAAAPTTAAAPDPQPLSAEAASDLAIREAAFTGYARSTLPMTPDQIVRLRQLFAQSQLAASTLPVTPPRPVATSQMVNLAPGATPPVVRLQQGYVSSLVFVDSTGAPWPIQAYDIGNPTAFNIQWTNSDNTLMIQPSAMYTSGNLAVRLKGLVTPVMLTLIPGQQAVDYRVDMRVQGIGPNATNIPTGEGLPPATNQELISVLDGIPPPGSRVLKITGGEAQAWLYNDLLYIRTTYSLLSPSWLSTMSSADGMKAYQMVKTPMILASANGKTIHLKIEGI